MIGALARKLFGSANERRIKGYLPRVEKINALEAELEKLLDGADEPARRLRNEVLGIESAPPPTMGDSGGELQVRHDHPVTRDRVAPDDCLGERVVGVLARRP